MGPEPRWVLEAGDLDGKNRSHFGVACNLLRRCTKLGKQGFAVHSATVRLRVGGAKQVAVYDLVTAKAGGIFDAVLDLVGLFCEQRDLGQESTQCVHVMGDGDSVHVAGLSVLPASQQLLGQ